LIDEVLAVSLGDNVKARELMPDGSYRRVPREAGQAAIRSQERFLELAGLASQRRLVETTPQAPPAIAPRPVRSRISRKRQAKT
jgi:polyphosphate kinase